MLKVNLVFITGNDDKRREVESILGTDHFNIINIKLDLPEIQSISVEDVIEEKIKCALKLVKTKKIFAKIKDKFLEIGITINSIKSINIICEYSGLYIKQMNNFPGALVKWYYESVDNKGIIKQNKGSVAESVCVIGLVQNEKVKKSIIGSRMGKIANMAKGNFGFGWDQSFIPDLSDTDYSIYNGKSYAELSPDIKNAISHRYDAFDKLKKIYELLFEEIIL